MLVGYTFLFLCYNWSKGLSGSAAHSGLAWLTWMSFAVFASTSGTVSFCLFCHHSLGEHVAECSRLPPLPSSEIQLLGAVSPSRVSVLFVLLLIWNIYNALSWALVPHPVTVQLFHLFFSWITPLCWYLGVLISNQIGPLKVTCLQAKLVTFEIPNSAATFAAYAADFLAAAPGHLTSLDTTSYCEYCSISQGTD